MSTAQVSAAPAEPPAWGAEGRDGPAEGARQREAGSLGGNEAAESGGRREPEPDERRRPAVAEAPPPKENPWTKRRAAQDGEADGQHALWDPGAGRGGGPGEAVGRAGGVLAGAVSRFRFRGNAACVGESASRPVPSLPSSPGSAFRRAARGRPRELLHTWARRLGGRLRPLQARHRERSAEPPVRCSWHVGALLNPRCFPVGQLFVSVLLWLVVLFYFVFTYLYNFPVRFAPEFCFLEGWACKGLSINSCSQLARADGSGCFCGKRWRPRWAAWYNLLAFNYPKCKIKLCESSIWTAGCRPDWNCPALALGPCGVPWSQHFLECCCQPEAAASLTYLARRVFLVLWPVLLRAPDSPTCVLLVSFILELTVCLPHKEKCIPWQFQADICRQTEMLSRLQNFYYNEYETFWQHVCHQYRGAVLSVCTDALVNADLASQCCAAAAALPVHDRELVTCPSCWGSPNSNTAVQ